MAADAEPRFCPHCGGRLRRERRGEHLRPVCTGCDAVIYRNPAVGVAVVLRAGGRILLGRRARGPYAGLWCIPCGYVEWDEDVRAAACRELREETGLEAELDEVLAVHSNFHDRARQTVGIWFAGRVVGGRAVAADDLDALDWFAPAAPPPLAFPTDADVLRMLAKEGNRCSDR